MFVIKAIIMGLVQGLTEFIPVSSSGHLILVGHALHFDGGLLFDTALNVGTLAALLLFFWRDFWDMARSLIWRNKTTKLAIMLIIATIPGVAAGVVLQKYAETIFRSDIIVGVNLVLVAGVMWLADRYNRGRLDIEHMTPERALTTGVAQAVALVPGVSRSGITIAAGLFQGFDRVTATRFSFLLSAPIIAGATLKVVLGHGNIAIITAQPVIFVAGVLAAFISGYWAIRFMLSYLSRHSLQLFIWYRLLAGLLVIALAVRR